MAANRHLVTVESIAEQLDNDRRLAQVTENAGAAVAASMAKAKLYGLIVNKSESGRPGDFDNMRTTSELIDAVRNELGESYAARLATLFGESSGQTAPDQDTTKLLTFESSGVERTTAISTG